MNNLLKKLAGLGGNTPDAPGQPVVNLAAFGKHPGWDDHIPGIGLETETLAHLKQSFYVTGIGGQIDSGAWEKLEPGKRVEGYDHSFLWLRQGHALLGRLWSSMDRKGRAKYPMVLCADSRGIPLGFLMECGGKELVELGSRCRALTTSGAVEAACQDSQARLRATLESLRETSGILPESRRLFWENPQFGASKVGLLRVLHELEDFKGSRATGRGAAGGGSGPGLCRHLRVPAIGRQPGEIFQLWAEFLRCVIPPNSPLLLILRADAAWLDVIVGEPSGAEFFCLQASPLALPLSTEIPYELKPELAAQLEALKPAFFDLPPAPPTSAKADENKLPPAPTPVPVSAMPSVSVKAVPAKSEPPAPAAPRPVRRDGISIWVILGVLSVLLIGAVVFFLNSSRSSTPTAAPVASTSATTPAPTATPSPAVSDSQPKYEASMKAARDALQQGQYQTAMTAAKAALVITPGDPSAAELQKEAQDKLDDLAKLQQSDQAYQTAMQKGQAAFDGQDYSNAVAQAAAALVQKPNDPKAAGLQQQAQAKLNELAGVQQQEAAYESAMAQALRAFDGKDFSTVIAQAQVALGIKPNDAKAQDLLSQAQRLQAAAASALAQQKQFDQLLADGQTALAQKDFETALAKANAALDLVPESVSAAELKTSASSQVKYQKAVAAGQAALQQNDYSGALQQAAAALAINPAGAEALKLQADASGGGDLQKARDFAAKDDLASALALCRQHPNQPDFGALAGQLTHDQLQKIDGQLEEYQVWFGLLNPDLAKSAAAKSAETRKKIQDLAESTFLDQNRTYYNYVVGQQETQLKNLSQLDPARQKIIAGLKQAISDHP